MFLTIEHFVIVFIEVCFDFIYMCVWFFCLSGEFNTVFIEPLKLKINNYKQEQDYMSNQITNMKNELYEIKQRIVVVELLCLEDVEDIEEEVGGDLEEEVVGDLEEEVGGDLEEEVGGDLEEEDLGDLEEEVVGDLEEVDLGE